MEISDALKNASKLEPCIYYQRKSIIIKNIHIVPDFNEHVNELHAILLVMTLLGYEPADLTVHPPPQNCRGWVHFFRIGVLCSPKNVLKRKPEYFGVIEV